MAMHRARRLMAVSPFDGRRPPGSTATPRSRRCSPPGPRSGRCCWSRGRSPRRRGALGIIPEASAAAIARAAREVAIDPAELAEGMAGAGVPVAALVKAFRRALGPEHGAWLHWGATTQDVVDTGLVLRLRRVLDILDERLERLIGTLADQAERHRETVIAARTRFQIATPTTLGAKIAVWGLPLVRHRTGSPSCGRGCSGSRSAAPRATTPRCRAGGPR